MALLAYTQARKVLITTAPKPASYSCVYILTVHLTHTNTDTHAHAQTLLWTLLLYRLNLFNYVASSRLCACEFQHLWFFATMLSANTIYRLHFHLIARARHVQTIHDTTTITTTIHHAQTMRLIIFYELIPVSGWPLLGFVRARACLHICKCQRVLSLCGRTQTHACTRHACCGSRIYIV